MRPHGAPLAFLLALLWRLCLVGARPLPPKVDVGAAPVKGGDADDAAAIEVDDTDSDGERRLASISGTLPATGLKLALTIAGSVFEAQPGQSVAATAGQSVQAFRIVLTNGDTFAAASARLKLVLSTVSDADAATGACTAAASALGPAKVNADFSGNNGVSTAKTAGASTLSAVLDASDGLVFKMGGDFSVCYSDTGDFSATHADIMGNVIIAVAGVYDACATADCLGGRPFFCHALRGSASASGSCALNYEGFAGNVGKATWSKAWAATYDNATGSQATLTKMACGSAADGAVMVADGSSEFVTPDAAAANKVVRLPATQALASVTTAYTLSACYCPDLGGCDSAAEYTQRIGVIYVFTSKFCDPSDGGWSCAESSGFLASTPGHTFDVLVHCPLGACAADNSARVKLVDSDANNDLPSWDALQGCGKALQTPLQVAPPNCATPATCASKGGSRQDWKLFDGNGAFQLDLGGTSYDRRQFHTAKFVDICLCLSACATTSNWFKVGQAEYHPYRILSFSGSEVGTVNVAGRFGFEATEGVLGPVRNGVVKLLAEDGVEADDTSCRNNGFDDSIISDMWATFRFDHQAQPDGGDATRLAFDSGNVVNTIKPVRAGIMAVCYCRFPSCASVSEDWVLTARLTVRGPLENQVWIVSVGVRFRISFLGQGLRATDTLRIVPPTKACTSDDNNPPSEESVLVGCPEACAAPPSGVLSLAPTLLSQDTVDCNHANTNCRTVYLRRVTVRSATTTELEFDMPPGLRKGDYIVLGSEVQCQADCTDEHLSAITGVHHFGGGSGSTYEVANRVIATPGLNRFLLPVGWSGIVPKFRVASMQGGWRRTNTAATPEDMQSIEAFQNLKVCWSYNGDGYYVHQAGSLTTVIAPTLALKLSLTTVAQDTAAPVVISFTTGDRNEYELAENSMGLKIIFSNTAFFEPRYTNGEALGESVGATDDDANQNMCGRLFSEMWSNDDAGFPIPQRCYHESVSGTVEMYLVFDAKNGLVKQQTFQVVMTALPHVSLTSTIDVVQVIAMDDAVLGPYHVVEHARAGANKGVLPKASGSLPQFLGTQGVIVLDGANEILELEQDVDLRLQLAGDATGKIVRQTTLRLFMFPLTVWDMRYTGGMQACQATCTAWGTTLCGRIDTCSVESVVDLQQLNMIRIELPGDMDAISGEVQHVFRINALGMPQGGFLPARFGAQVSSTSGAHYTLATGSYLWKRPAAGLAVAELVTREGDGNTKPFPGDTSNILHAHLRLAVTLRAVAHNGIATLTVSMPAGYMARGMAGTELNLVVFEGATRLGRGRLDSTRWSCAGASCTYALQRGDMLPAGSDVFASFVVDNPSQPLQQNSSMNTWSMRLRGSGDSPVVQELDPVAFCAVSRPDTFDFGANVAVLGRLRDHCMQPTNFTPGWADDVSIFYQTNNVFVFFQAAQTTLGAGVLFVDAPEGFEFNDSCACGDLDSPYYHASGLDRTWPLPGILSCRATSSSVATAGVAARNRAMVRLRGMLRADRRYGFQIHLLNGQFYDASQTRGWRLWTGNADGRMVDGTDGTVPFVPTLAGVGASPTGTDVRSWAMYERQLDGVQVELSSLFPYNVSGEEAIITVFPLSLLENITATLRILAPLGYSWQESMSEFVGHCNLTATAGELFVPGATADFPGGVPPTVLGGELVWPAAAYNAGERYGFKAKIRVPSSTPTRSSNAFFVQFGYADYTTGLGARVLAARVPALAVRALSDAAIDYSSNLVSAPNVLRFSVRTATAIPSQGGLLIRGPVGFVLPDACRPASVIGDDHSDLPKDVSCTFQAVGSTEVRLHLVAGDSGMPPGRYVFELAGSNPTSTAQHIAGEATSCGWTQCWMFHSLEAMQDGLDSPEVDARASAPGFAIKARMPSAGFALLDRAAMSATGRNDKPLAPNALAFVFSLGTWMASPGTLTLRGPEGIEFAEDCLVGGGVVTNAASFDATTAAALNAIGTWEPGVSVVTCRGTAAMAELDVGAGLQPFVPYLFLIKVASNPRRTPERNRWSLETPQEASIPFDGFPLWTFTRVSVVALSSALARAGDATLARTPNLVNITFRPYQSVGPPGELQIVAPTGFSFVHDAGVCTALLVERDPIQIALSESDVSSFFASTDVACRVNPSNVSLVRVQFQASRSLVAGRDYNLLIAVKNPPFATPIGADAPAWALQSLRGVSTSSSLVALDAVTAVGFSINPAAEIWEQSVTEEFTPNGNATLEGLTFMLSFEEELRPAESLVIIAPPGFDLADPEASPEERRCNALSWGPESAKAWADNLVAECAGGRLVVHIGGASNVPAATVLLLQLTTVNPLISPPHALNYWRVEHRDVAGGLVASEVFQGWRIISQLQVSAARLIGDGSAGSTGTLEFMALPVNNATLISVEAVLPVGFVFDQADPDVPGQAITEAFGGKITLSATIVSGVTITVRVTGVKLPPTGGATLFNLVTCGSDGLILDRRIGYDGGFRLPGSITVEDLNVENEYQRNPTIYPLKSLWPVQYGTVAIASFVLAFSDGVDSSAESLNVIGAPFDLVSRDLQVVDVQGARTVIASVVSAAGGALQVRLGASLEANRKYRLSIGVVAPGEGAAIDTVWRVYTSDGGDLPKSRNFNIQPLFQLVTKFSMTVQALKSPPTATVEVIISISLGAGIPSAFELIAPSGFTFPRNCLVFGAGVVASCAPGLAAVGGRPTARLTTTSGSAAGALNSLKLKVVLPDSTPASRSWFVQGLQADTGLQVGWGEDPAGFEVLQMRDAAVIYAGIPGIQTQLAVKFRVGETVGRGSKIVLRTPPGFVILCGKDAISELSVPGVVQCQIDGNSLALTVNGVLTPGEHAFALTVTTPSATPLANTFAIILRSVEENVLDAAMTVPGQRMRQDLLVDSASISWTSAEAAQASSITLAFKVRETISRGTVGSLLITLPQNFEHTISQASSVVSSNPNLRFSVDSSLPDRVALIVDVGRDIPVGSYSLEFPVSVPEYMPSYNVWLITFCSYGASGLCTQFFSPLALFTFPVAGFPLEEPRGSVDAGRGGGARALTSPPLLLAPIAMVAARVAAVAD